MYKVMINNQMLMEPSENLLLISPEVRLADNSAGSFSFRIDPLHPAFSEIKHAARVRVFSEEEDLFLGRIIEIEKDFMGVLSVKAEGELAYLADSIQRPQELHNISVRGFLENLISHHNEQSPEKFEVGIVTVTDPNDSLYRYTNYESTLECIQTKLIENLGGHLQIRHENGVRKLDYLADYRHVSGQYIRFGENLLDYSGSSSLLDIATVVIPLGARTENRSIEALDSRVTIASVNDGSDALESPEAIERYGRITKVAVFNDVTTPTVLKKRGEEWLKNNRFTNLELTVSAVDLSILDSKIEKFHLLDLITVESDYHDVRTSLPLREMTVHLLEPDLNTYTLGTVQQSYTESASRSQIKASKQLDRIPLASSLLSQAKDQAAALLSSFGKEGHIVFVQDDEENIQELCIIDTDSIETAKKVWRFNMGGLGFSGSGYGGPYETAITMDGTIVGNLIAAHTIAGDKIDVAYTTAQEKKWQDELGANYFTATQTTHAINTSAEGVKLFAQEMADQKLSDYYTKSQIDVTVDGINSTVSRKVGSSEIVSKINQSAEGLKISGSLLDVDAEEIRLKSSTLVWTSSNSRMSEDGTLSCQNANIRGSLKTGASNSSDPGVIIDGGRIYIVPGGSDSSEGPAKPSVPTADKGAEIVYSGPYWQQYYTSSGQSGDMIDSSVPSNTAPSIKANDLLLDISGRIYIRDGQHNSFPIAWRGWSGEVTVSGKTLKFINGICVKAV